MKLQVGTRQSRNAARNSAHERARFIASIALVSSQNVAPSQRSETGPVLRAAAGRPAKPVPATLNEPPHKCDSYQQPVLPKAMCGSLANSGRPVAECLPSTSQLLLPAPSSGSPTTSPTRSPALRGG